MSLLFLRRLVLAGLCLLLAAPVGSFALIRQGTDTLRAVTDFARAADRGVLVDADE